MLESIKIYTSDKYWRRVFDDLGMVLTDSPDGCDVNFDEVNIGTPISVDDLVKRIFDLSENADVITSVFGKYLILPKLQHKIIVALYKNPGITMHKLKEMLGVLPDVTTHTVENAVYQLRKKYGHALIQNTDGKYKIGHI